MNKLSNRNNSNSPSRSTDFTSRYRPLNKSKNHFLKILIK